MDLGRSVMVTTSDFGSENPSSNLGVPTSSLKVSKNRLLLGKGKSKKDSRQSLDDATMLEDLLEALGCFTERIGFEVKSGQFREEPYESLQPQVKKRASA